MREKEKHSTFKGRERMRKTRETMERETRGLQWRERQWKKERPN